MRFYITTAISGTRHGLLNFDGEPGEYQNLHWLTELGYEPIKVALTEEALVSVPIDARLPKHGRGREDFVFNIVIGHSATLWSVCTEVHKETQFRQARFRFINTRWSPRMPRYYFNIRQDKFVAKDEEGADFPNDDAARDEAVAGARDILSEAVFSGEAASLNRQIEVTDEAGKTVVTVPVGHVTGTDTQS